MIKAILLTSAVFASSLCFAGTSLTNSPSPKIDGVEICKSRALEKLTSYDASAQADVNSFRLVSLDARTFNPSHYAWYEMEISVNGATKTVRTLVQLNRLTGKCI